jgi:hypothetical protein
MKVESDMRKTAIAFALFSSVVMQAPAGPGYQLTRFAVVSMQEQFVVEALKEYSESKAVEDFKSL